MSEIALVEKCDEVARTDPMLPVRTRSGEIVPLAELAEAMYMSGMFKDIRSVHQAKVKILAGRELGVPPVQAMNGIYIIEGKTAMAATLMAGLILKSGTHKYRVIQLDDNGCSIQFYERNDVGEWIPSGPASTFSRPDAQTAQLLGKDVWKKWFRNMAFARALSNGARWYCGDVFLGPVYVPEELGAEVNEDGEVLTVTIPTGPDADKPKPDRNEWHRAAAKRIYPFVAPEVSRRIKEAANDADMSSEDFTTFLKDVAKIHAIELPKEPEQPQEAEYVDIQPGLPLDEPTD